MVGRDPLSTVWKYTKVRATSEVGLVFFFQYTCAERDNLFSALILDLLVKKVIPHCSTQRNQRIAKECGKKTAQSQGILGFHPCHQVGNCEDRG